MATVKTAISLQESLYKRLEEMAEEMSVTRSHLYSLALEEFVRRQHYQQLLCQIDAAYDDGLDETEQAILQTARNHQRRLQEHEEW